MSISVKISEENYGRLCEISGRLQEKLHKPVSVNEAIDYLCSRKKLSDFAGSWEMSDEEAEKILKDLRKGWSRWSIKSA